jgi:hypothetical protein
MAIRPRSKAVSSFNSRRTLILREAATTGLVASLTLLGGCVESADLHERHRTAGAESSRHLRVESGDGHVSVSARDMPLGTILEEIAHQNAFIVSSQQPLDERVTLEMDRLPLRVAMKRLLPGRSFILQVGQQADASDAPPGKLWIFSHALVGSDIGLSMEPLDADRAIEHAKLALADSDARVRLKAVAALSRVDAAQALSMLSASALNDGNSAVRQEAVFALSEAGKADMQIFKRTLTDSDAKVREATIEALAKIGGEESAHALAMAMNDDDASLRQEAVNALGEIGGPTAIELLHRALQDEHFSVRESAATYLIESSQSPHVDTRGFLVD